MGDSGPLRALLLTNEESMIASFSAVCAELGIHALTGSSSPDLARDLHETKFAAVVVDFDRPEFGENHLPTLQESKVNRNSVVVAVSANTKNLERALQNRAHFVLKRPIQEVEVRRTLNAAYDLMLSDRRRRFRCSIVLPVRLRMVRSGSTFECSSVNVSANGVAVYSSMRLKPTESVDVEIVLPDGSIIAASGIIVWDDGHGKSGIHFQCRTQEVRKGLDAWLAVQEAAVAKGELIVRDFAKILPAANVAFASKEAPSL